TSWSVERALSGGVRLRCSNEAGIDSLVLTYGSEDTIRAALSASRHVSGHARRAGARPDDDLLLLDTGAYGLDQAVAWMQRRLGAGIDAALERAPGTSAAGEADGWLWTGLGAVAIGDHERARRCASVLEGLGRPVASSFVKARAALSDGRTVWLLEDAARCLSAIDVVAPVRSIHVSCTLS